MKPSLLNKIPTIEKTETISGKRNREIQVDTLKLPTGESYEYVTFVSQIQAVMVLAETKDKKYVMNEEYRHPTKKFLLSLPGGCVDEGEQPEDAAPRELFEETGYEAQEFIFLGKSFPFPGQHGQETFYYLAKEAHKASQPKLELCEIVETVEMSLDEIHERLLKADNLDGHITTALYFKMLRKL